MSDKVVRSMTISKWCG